MIFTFKSYVYCVQWVLVTVERLDVLYIFILFDEQIGRAHV